MQIESKNKQSTVFYLNFRYISSSFVEQQQVSSASLVITSVCVQTNQNVLQPRTTSGQ